MRPKTNNHVADPNDRSRRCRLLRLANTKSILILVLLGVFLFCPYSDQPSAKINGSCAYCHTMHNSQRDIPNTFDGSSNPNPCLTKGDCKGCHAQRKTEYVVTLGTVRIPQVYHSNPSYDLAGGNFGYIDGTKGSSPSSTKGHNVVAAITSLTGETLARPPGAEMDTGITNSNFTCAGQYGCHGDRNNKGNAAASMKGAHHGESSTLDGSTVARSYRFLKGVKGIENNDSVWGWQNYDTGSSNRYKGANMPDPDATTVFPGASGTISGFCSECHGKFHGPGENGHGSSAAWLRHPTDTLLPNTGEYLSYDPVNAFDGTVPVAYMDPTTPTRSTAVVMCLSCHGAHGTNFSYLLRWDYSNMIAGNGGQYAETGCFKCHRDKD
ncbi:MAG: cytochrome c3 family protein [Pseudomonadota bacterium]